MRDDFAVLILTHGRPDSVVTLNTLKTYGYTGKVAVVCDDEDEKLPLYSANFGKLIEVFSKDDAEEITDTGDALHNHRGVIYARNASFEIAKRLGVKYFMQLDDDYTGFYCRYDDERRYGVFPARFLEPLFEAMIEYFEAAGLTSLCMSQGGDHIGGGSGGFGGAIKTKRKAMNTFLCSVERPFRFVGRINEDANTYILESRRGALFLTLGGLQVNQRQTQRAAGGMTDLYLDFGTYAKSFYSVLYSPSCVSIRDMGWKEARLHHHIDWTATAPKIIAERHRREA